MERVGSLFKMESKAVPNTLLTTESDIAAISVCSKLALLKFTLGLDPLNSIDAIKAFDKIQHPFMTKVFCLCVSLCTMSMSYPGRSEEGIRSPGTDLCKVFNCHVDAGNGTWVLCKGSSALNRWASVQRIPHEIKKGVQGLADKEV
ncbi:hypothetical protein STEG23_011373 [Scotinomys teguina]